MQIGPIKVKPRCDWFTIAKDRRHWLCRWCRKFRRTLKAEPPSDCVFD